MSQAHAPNHDNLVKMANHIAQFFESQSPEKAPTEIAGHLKKFWPPPMRASIKKYVESGGSGLRDAAAKAVALL